MRVRLPLGAAILVAAMAAAPSHAELTSKQLQRLALAEAALRQSVAQAKDVCLSSYSKTQQMNFFAGLSKDWLRFLGVGGVASAVQVSRGADVTLRDSLRRVENVDIRKCMDRYVQPRLATYGQVLDSVVIDDEIDLVDFRFAFQRLAPLDTKRYTENLMLRAMTPTRPVERRISLQDPTGDPYFVQDFRYPPAGKTITGAIVPELRTAEYSGTARKFTGFCIQRGAPASAAVFYDHYLCKEGQDCQPSPRSTRLFGRCPAPVAEAAPRLWRASLQDPPAAPPRPHWEVPSLETLAERESPGVGYTIFSVKTDAFRNERDMIAVEVGLKINGVAVDEDGLPPQYRPVAARAGETFNHRFGLETLNFEGADRGCEAVELKLTPLRADGRRGTPRVSRLAYVAFRDVRPADAAAGDLSWSATYIRPDKEWRNMAFVKSYPYVAADPAARARVVDAVTADKGWLDRAGYLYQGQQVVGVVRPPRTLQPDGSAAYGLIAGLRQSSGAVRFTFNKAGAQALGAFLVAQRAGNARAAAVIQPQPFVLATASGVFSLPGVCDD
jgi:hypothetical protein